MPSLQAKIKQQRGGFSDFFEVGVGEHRLETGVKRGPARPARVLVTRVLLQALVVIPMTTKDFSVFMSQMRPNSLAPEHTS